VRKQLRDRNGRRGRFSATFKKFGSARDPHRPWVRTALFLNVRDESGEVVTDHIWFRLGELFGRLNLQPGDEVFFLARVKKYWKRNPDIVDEDDPRFVEDYKLSYPSKVQKLAAQPVQDMPLFDQCPEVQA
jgi:hypothetical protein